MSKLIRIETKKELKRVIDEIKKKANNFNFIIRNIFDMSEEFKNHGVEVAKDFEYYSIMLCNPFKAYKNRSENPIRGAVLIPPKQIILYKKNDKTIIAYMSVEKDDIKKILPNDKLFQKGLSESCMNITKLIKQIAE
ncbi:DUF302 domain-containing protein [archaeon]|jgi:uncharacterized protein (DUF302 family)|nr:DUF302 domain-containing protein [archaeon]MBT3465057.1 DUF302 domain-containing protein [archaeon]MBT6869270.1 DUF302 domain-containing protein [archaeon]MBT7193668.1 DUF302 domain-containing protein [archaeon]MBT7381220.1 DUF302 domain-containing protein [archaeon]